MAAAFFDPKMIERTLLRKFFLEGAALFGSSITIELVNSVIRNTYDDPQYTRLLPKIINIILDHRPKASMLKRYNWYVEDKEEMPIVAYINTYEFDDQREFTDFTPLIGAIINLPMDMSSTTSLYKYIINDIKLMPEYVWICKLSPYRAPVDIIRDDKQDVNYQYLKVPQK